MAWERCAGVHYKTLDSKNRNMAAKNLERSDTSGSRGTHFDKFVDMLKTALSVLFFSSDEEHSNKILFRTNNFVFEVFHHYTKCAVERDLDSPRKVTK